MIKIDKKQGQTVSSILNTEICKVFYEEFQVVYTCIIDYNIFVFEMSPFPRERSGRGISGPKNMFWAGAQKPHGH
jgi:hypothetical protein